MSNPMYEAQLNRHEEAITDIKGRLHSYDLGLRWCEEQIKRLAGDDYSPVVVVDDAIEKEYDKLKNDHNLLKEEHKVLEDKLMKTQETLEVVREQRDNYAHRVEELEEANKHYEYGVVPLQKKKILELKNSTTFEIERWKDAYLRSQVDVDNFQRAYSESKMENDRLSECLDKYSWKRVDNTQLLPFENNELYLFVVDGYSSPVIGRYYGNAPSYITIIEENMDGKGPKYKIVFFMDGVIRYWMPLPEMPETAIK